MPPTFTNLADDFYNPGANSSASHSITVPVAGAAVGEIVFLGVMTFVGTVGSVSDSKSNSWHQVTVSTIDANHTVNVWYSVITVALVSGDTITFSPVVQFRACASNVAKASGQASGATPGDGSATNNGANPQTVSVTATSGATNDLAYYFSGQAVSGVSTTTLSASAGWTVTGQVSSSYDGGVHFISGGCSTRQANASPLSCTHTWSASGNVGIVGSLFSAAPTTAVKTAEGLALASVKTAEGLALASVKTWEGLA